MLRILFVPYSPLNIGYILVVSRPVLTPLIIPLGVGHPNSTSGITNRVQALCGPSIIAKRKKKRKRKEGENRTALRQKYVKSDNNLIRFH